MNSLHSIFKMFRPNKLKDISGKIVLMIQAFLPSMKERNHGHVVPMSSMADLFGFKDLVPYCGAWYAVRGVMKALENELCDETKGNSQIKFTTIGPYMENMGACKYPRFSYKDSMMIEIGQSSSSTP